MMHRIRFGSAVVLAMLVLGQAPARADVGAEREQQRLDYAAALQAVRAGNIAAYRRLLPKLDGYVLQGYVEYAYLRRHLPQTPPDQIRRFIEDDHYLPVADALRTQWLHYLAARGDWDPFLKESADVTDDTGIVCLRLDRLFRDPTAQAALAPQIQTLWLTGRPQPPECQPLFAAWRRAGYMSEDLVWKRIQMAMDQNELTLAGSLARDLPAKDRVWLWRWIAMHRDPYYGLAHIDFPVNTPTARMVIEHGVVRMGYRDPVAAMAEWQRLKQRYQFFGEDDNYVLRWLGVLAAQDHLPQAVDWLSQVVAEPNDATLRVWRVKAALRAGRWQTARRFIDLLTANEQSEPEWRYWKARALEKTGDTHAADDIYAQLARVRNYYGFLAADRLGLGYSMQDQNVTVTPEQVSAMLARPGIEAAQELYEMNQIVPARRQWNWTIRNMSDQDLQVAAVIARYWGWHDRAIYTVVKSDQTDDLELRFPLVYRELVEQSAQQNDIDPGWIYGVVRQESAFVPDARSPAGALGLMQIMPSTGWMTGRLLNLRIRTTQALLDIANNLRLGATYLRTILRRHDNRPVLATAAYNAGPYRISQWLPENKALPADVWVDTIPYNETRNYVKNVMAYTMVYDYRLGNDQTRLSAFMPEIRPND